MLSANSSFISTNSPALIFSTRLAGIGGSAGDKITGVRWVPATAGGLAETVGLLGRVGRYDAVGVHVIVDGIVVTVATDAMLPGAGSEPNDGSGIAEAGPVWWEEEYEVGMY